MFKINYLNNYKSYLTASTFTRAFGASPNISGAYIASTRLGGSGPEPVRDNRTPEELEDYVGHRWWSVPDIAAAPDRFFPGRLPELLPAFLAGVAIEEPFEWWN